MNLFEEAKEFEMQTKRINLKKLCRYIDKYNKDFDGVDISKLINAMMTWDELEHKVFQCYFVRGLTKMETASECSTTGYKVAKLIKTSLNRIAFDSDIVRKMI